jgi:predicted nucleic acid-binding protein
MMETAFLDTGVVLAYCFTNDIHHYKCRNYIEDDTLAVFISEDIEDAYRRKEPHLTERYSDAVLVHVSDLQRSEYEGQLDPLDIAHS